MFATFALTTVLMTTSCGGAGWSPRTTTPAFAPAPTPSLAEQIPLPARLGVYLLTPAPVRPVVAPLLIAPSSSPRLATAAAPKPVAKPATVAAPKVACPLCAGHAGAPASMFGKRFPQVQSPLKLPMKSLPAGVLRTREGASNVSK